MNNFFKKLLPKKEAFLNQEAIMDEIPARVSKAIYPKEVEEIHHEFETAADKLLEEAKSIITEASTKNVDKVIRLEILGFKQAGQVAEFKPLMQKAELSKEQIELINYYKREYPFNKFIDEEGVKSICHKYNLVCGDVGRFKGFVPEVNLKQIERFKLKAAEVNLVQVEAFDYQNKRIGIFSSENAVVKFSTSGYYHLYSTENSKECSFQQPNAELAKKGEFYGKDYANLFGLRDKVELGIIIQILNNKLQICAPVKDMDISGLELVEGYKLQKKHIPDPVVLQPVKGGYLILAAWGDEASDPLVINEILN